MQSAGDGPTMVLDGGTVGDRLTVPAGGLVLTVVHASQFGDRA